MLHIITQSYPLGGAQHNTLALAARADRSRFRSEIACGPGGPLIEAARAADVPVHVLPTLDNPLNPVADARALLDMMRLCRRGRFDIVHTHSTKAGVLGRLAARACRIPVVVHTIHGVPFNECQPAPFARAAALWSERLARRWCHQLIAIGNTVADDFARAGVCARGDILTIRSGIDFSRLDAPVDRGGVRRRLGIGAHQPMVGAVGHLREAKGYPYLLHAVRMVRERVADLKVIIVGEGELAHPLRALARELGLEECCTFLGRRPDVPELLRAMDIFAQASLWEGVPRAVQEAMYVGLPVVATDVNGTSEIVEHGVTGLLVPPRDAHALAQEIGDLLGDRERAARLGAQGRRGMSAEFSIERTVQRTEALYLALAARR